MQYSSNKMFLQIMHQSKLHIQHPIFLSKMTTAIMKKQAKPLQSKILKMHIEAAISLVMLDKIRGPSNEDQRQKSDYESLKYFASSKIQFFLVRLPFSRMLNHHLFQNVFHSINAPKCYNTVTSL